MKKPTIKMRLKEKDGQIWLRALIRHPMETGLRKDAATSASIPAHYINHVIVEANGEVVFSADWSIAISKNPVLLIKFDGANGDKVKLTWTDNMGESDFIEMTVETK
ncbi:MAG: thiosulfate oxidation carrier complex protein SoxZ [Sedimenticolaceae bacterium]